MQIATATFKQDPNNPLYSVQDKVLTNLEVSSQIHDALKQIPHAEEGTAYCHCEWVRYESYDKRFSEEEQFPFPNQPVLVTWDYGPNEGFLIVMLVCDRTGDQPVYRQFCSIKFLNDEEWVKYIQSKLHLAFRLGR